jgi:hypothetical protein
VSLCCPSVINVITFVCSVTFVVVVEVAAVVIKCIYSFHYEHTSYTLFIYLCVSQWCDNDKHDLPQHVIGTVKWRDVFDGNKCRSVLIFSVPVTDIVSI